MAVLSVIAQQPARDIAPTSPTGTATLSGIVLNADATGDPIRSASVTLTDVDGRAKPQTTAADERGRFAFTALPAGRYTLSVYKPAFLKTSYGATRPERAGTPIAVADGQQLTDVVVKMWRGGAITGRLVDAKGHPIPGARVAVKRIRLVNGERTLDPSTGSTATDDRGVYRIFGLAPAEYVVLSAGFMNGTFAPPNIHQVTEEDIQRALQGQGAAIERTVVSITQYFDSVPVYFPGTVVAVDAVPVRVGAGEEVAGIDFAVHEVPTSKIEGVITMPDGSPLISGSASLRARSGASGFGPTQSGSVGADGKLLVAGVTPGDYELIVRATPGVASRARGGGGRGGGVPADTLGWWAKEDVNVNGRDIAGLSLVLQPNVTFAGRVVFEGATTPPASASGATITLAPQRAAGNFVPQKAVATPAHTFAIANIVPADYMLSASLPNGAPGVPWTLKSVTAGGRDVTDVAITIPATGISDAVVTFTDRPTEISGVFQDASGRPAPDYFLIAFSTDRSHWKVGSRFIQQVRPATDGTFTVIGLPPGEYVLAATADLDPNDLSDTAFLDTLLAATPVRFTLREGEKKTQDLRIAGKTTR